jgi:phage repressor protein C with HTH and peptisase S24 domain
MGITDDFKKILQEAEKAHSSLNKLCLEAGVDYASIYKWLRGQQKSLNLSTVAKLLDFLGMKIQGPDKVDPTTKEVCFVDAQLMPAGENVAPPQAEAYLAAPLVGEVGAGPGYLDQDQVLSWFLVYRYALPAGHSNDLIAVQIGARSTSMQPTLYPGDIVLVDRGDTDISYTGRMMLVRDPDDGSGMIKRVSIKPAKDDNLIIYYSDNAAEFEPMIYSLGSDFAGDLSNAIVGRVIWAWSDVRNK